jgi:hypothetical protein
MWMKVAVIWSSTLQDHSVLLSKKDAEIFELLNVQQISHLSTKGVNNN